MPLTGLEILEKVKYEIKHNSTAKPNRTVVNTEHLEVLINLAETNQMRISLETADLIMELNKELAEIKENEKKLISLLNQLQKGNNQ